MLIRLGAIDQAKLDSAVREQDRDGRGRALGRILVDSGRITPQDLAQAAEEQCIESLAHVIVSPHGSFVFNRDLRPVIRRGLLSLNAEGIVLEAARRADEMTHLRGLLPPPGVNLGLTPKANAQTSPLGVAETLVVDALRREPRSLAKLGEELPIEEVALWRAIVRLRERGMIYAVGDAPVDAVEHRIPDAPRSERSIPEVLRLGAGGNTPSTKPVPTLDEIRKGKPAGEAIVSALTALLDEVLTDRNQRRTLQELSHYSDDYFRRRGMMETAEIEALRHDGPPLPIADQEALTGVRDVRLLTDDRATSIVITRRPGSPETRTIMVFAPFNDAWRIDADLG